MVPAMFGMGGTEILVILVVALLFLGPDKLPEAAKQISKGIRDIKRQSRALQQTIEDDEHIGGAIRDLKSALRGEDLVVRPKPIKPAELTAEAASLPGAPEYGPAIAVAAAPNILGAGPTSPDGAASSSDAPDAPEAASDTPSAPAVDGDASAPGTSDRPALTLPPVAGERDHDEPSTLTSDDAVALAALVKQAPNTIARGSSSSASPGPAPSIAASAEPVADDDTPETKHG